jgi:hypothetical protein
METGFHDPIRAKPKAKTEKSPWNFEAPKYDDRTRVCAGTHYGVGHKTPVGHEGDPKPRSATLPMGRVKTMSVDHEDYKVRVEE